MSDVNAVVDWLVAQWVARFSEITLTMGDLQPEMHVRRIEDTAVKSGLLWWEQAFTCAPESPLWVGAPESAWTDIGAIVLAAAGVDPAPASEIKSTYLEIVRQSMGSLGNDITSRMSAQIMPTRGAEAAPRDVARHVFRIETKLPNKMVEFFFIVCDDLCHVILSPPSSSATTFADHSHAEQPEATSEHAGIPASRTFELLLDVELPISVSFGRAAVKLQDAIKLITGSLIELDRGLTDPVDLLVNNCVIARGEVVVIDGNYGVRVTEIVSQKERLQQTRRYMLQ